MGAWGSGNFDSDAAEELCDQVVQFIVQRGFLDWIDSDGSRKGRFQGEATDEAPGAAAELLLRMNVYLPEPDDLKRWTTAVLQHYDRVIDSLQPGPGFKEQRRKTLVETFDRLITRSIEQRSEDE